MELELKESIHLRIYYILFTWLFSNIFISVVSLQTEYSEKNYLYLASNMSDSVFQHFSAVGMFDALTNTVVEILYIFQPKKVV